MKIFRFKIVTTYIVLLSLFVVCMFPLISKAVQNIVVESMGEAADDLIARVQIATDDVGIIEIMKYQQPYIFFRVSIINAQDQVIYDSHTRRLVGSEQFPLTLVSSVDIETAKAQGVGYCEKYSYILEQRLVYLAKKFRFHGKDYIIRLAFPFDYIRELKKNFRVGSLFFSSICLLLFSMMTGGLLYYFTRPIRQIIREIRPYQEGKVAEIPEIIIRNAFSRDEFSQLADTLNSLSHKIKVQIEKLTQEHHEKEMLLQNLAEGVLAVDDQMNVVYANSAAEKFLSLSTGVVGHPFPFHQHAKSGYFLKQAKEQGISVNETVDIQIDGNTLYFHVISVPLSTGGALLVLHDLTMHYKILEMRKDFIANASHELKTPITIIRGFAETLHDNLQLDKKIIKEITEKIVNNCKRMTKIIKNFLTLADIENLPVFKLSRCNVYALVDACRAHLLSVYPHAHVIITTEKECEYFVDAEPQLLETAIYNLLDNAAKYAGTESPIDIVLKKQKGSVVIIVQDHGIGIPKSDLEHIFERFYTVNKIQSKKLGGSGLGLSIVKTIVQKHLGAISVESVLSSGTVFTIVLPDNLKEKLSKDTGGVL